MDSCCKLTNRACGALVPAEIDISVNGHAVHFFVDVFFPLHDVNNGEENPVLLAT